MALVPRCDRCRCVDVQVVAVLGHDLCNQCIGEFRCWAKTPPAVPPARKRGERIKTTHAWRVASALLAEHGEITQEAFARATGQIGRGAYWVLRGLVKQGLLRSERRLGELVFVASRREAAE